MIDSYLYEIPLESVKKPIKRQGFCTKATLGKKSKNNFINTHQEWIVFGIQKAVVQRSKTNMYLNPGTWMQGCQNVFK